MFPKEHSEAQINLWWHIFASYDYFEKYLILKYLFSYSQIAVFQWKRKLLNKITKNIGDTFWPSEYVCTECTPYILYGVH